MDTQEKEQNLIENKKRINELLIEKEKKINNLK